MSAFQKLIYEVDLCQVIGDRTSHCHTICRTERMMAIYSAGNWDAKIRTQSDSGNTFALLKSEKSTLMNGLVNTPKSLFSHCPVKLISLYIILTSHFCEGYNLYVSQLPILVIHSFATNVCILYKINKLNRRSQS